MAKEYTDIYGQKWAVDCLGCLPKDDPKLRALQPIWSDEHFVLHPDITAPIPGLVILETRRHVRTVLDFNEAEEAAYNGLEKKIRKALKDALGLDSFVTYQHDSSSHFHRCFLPYYPWMNQFDDAGEHLADVLDYSRQRMKNEEVFRQLEEANQKLKEVLK